MRKYFGKYFGMFVACGMVIALLACQRQSSPEGAPLSSPAEIAADAGMHGPLQPGKYAIGVPECDDYIVRSQRCITTRVPEELKGPLLNYFNRYVDQWQKAVLDPAQKEHLVESCRVAKEELQVMVAKYQCFQ